MPAPDSKLPDDIDALKAMVTAMAEQQAQVEVRNAALEARNKQLEAVNRQAEERIARLTAAIKVLERARFGRRSERLRAEPLSEEQYALVFDEIETGVAAIKAELEKAPGAVEAQTRTAATQKFCGSSRTGRGDHRAGSSGMLEPRAAQVL